MNIPWVWLIFAGALEVAWAVMLKQTDGFSRLWPSVWVLITGGLSLICLGMAVRELPIGAAYAIWTGIGTAGTVLFGMIYLGEPRDALRLVFILFILVGCLGLKLVTGQAE